MQSPILIFDHVNKQIVQLQPGPATDERLAEAAKQAQAATSGSSANPAA